MTLSEALNRRIKARTVEDDSENYPESSLGSDGSDAESGGLEQSDAGSDEEMEDEDELDDASDLENSDINTLNQISFGALAKAQASLGPSSKHKCAGKTEEAKPSPLDDIRARIRNARSEKGQSATTTDPSKKGFTPLPHRSSKHAPTVQSSKYAVTRRRTVVDSSTTALRKARDPRFDSTVLSHSTSTPSARGTAQAAANANYAFLSDYRATELASLKQQLRNGKMKADEREELKRKITSMADRMKTFERKQREVEVVREHKRKERELLKEGKKSQPYFLKKGDVKREVLKKRFEEMGAKERQKSIMRRRKKVASRERREMPAMRREIEE